MLCKWWLQKTYRTFFLSRWLFEQSLVVHFSSSFLAFPFVLWTMSSLTSGAAVPHELTGSAFLQANAILAAGGALCIGWRDHGLRTERRDVGFFSTQEDQNDTFSRRNNTIYYRGNQNRCVAYVKSRRCFHLPSQQKIVLGHKQSIETMAASTAIL